MPRFVHSLMRAGLKVEILAYFRADLKSFTIRIIPL